MVDTFHHEMYLQNFIDSKLFADFFLVGLREKQITYNCIDCAKSCRFWVVFKRFNVKTD